MANTYFDAASVSFANGSDADAPDVNDLADEAESGFDLLPDKTVLRENRANYATDAGAANAHVTTTTESWASLVAGNRLSYFANAANTSDVTNNANSLGVKSVLTTALEELTSGEISEDELVDMVYDGTQYQKGPRTASGSAAVAAADAATASSSLSTQDTLFDDSGLFDTASLYAKGYMRVNRANTEFEIQNQIKQIAPVDIHAISFSSKELDVNSQQTNPRGLAFKPDGLKMYLIGSSADSVDEYTLSTAWDVSSASAVTTFNTKGEDSSPWSISLKSDGAKFYVMGASNDTIYQYSMSTAYDISTASYDSVSLSVSGQDSTPYGLDFSSDGTKMYVTGGQNDTVYQYTLSTAWDLSTASYASLSLDLSNESTTTRGGSFHSDGTRYIVTNASGEIVQYNLSTAWDVSTGSYSGLQFDATTWASGGNNVHYSANGTYVYLISSGSDDIYQFFSSRLVST